MVREKLKKLHMMSRAHPLNQNVYVLWKTALKELLRAR